MGKEQVDEKHEIKFFEIIYKLIEFVSALCLCGQVIIISIAVIGRYIFSYTPTWSEEIARVLMVWMSFLTASMAIKDNSHVRISVFDKFFGARVVITDRLHGMVFCAITKTPCIVTKSLDHKVTGTYEWIKDLNYIKLVDNLNFDEVEKLITELSSIKEYSYIDFDSMYFNKLREKIENNGGVQCEHEK